ncbi:MAG TPA: hypothetical protein VFF06_18925 [Polyangia bacterium]|nr:hypothetical protein [Polyangia bacterium]
MMRPHRYVVFVLLSGCAATPAAMRAADSASLTQADADRVAAEYRRRVEPDPRRAPRSLDDVVEALRRDRLADFPAAYGFTVEHAGDPGALALGAQLQLAWGEDQLIVAEILAHEVERSPERVRAEIGDVRGALARDARGHLDLGMQLAREIIAASPADYHGYRVAADYDRIVGDWAGFDRDLARLEALDPQSNGYLFLRGMEQLSRRHDRRRAESFFRKALARDPKFARAEVQLLLARGGIDAEYDDYRRLKAVSPEHQIVEWLGPFIERQHTERAADDWRRESFERDLTEELVLRR